MALVGARNEEQVKQNAGALDVQLSADELDEISRELGKLELKLD